MKINSAKNELLNENLFSSWMYFIITLLPNWQYYFQTKFYSHPYPENLFFLRLRNKRNIFFSFPGFKKKSHKLKMFGGLYLGLVLTASTYSWTVKRQIVIENSGLLPDHLSQSWRWVTRFKPQEVKERRWAHDLCVWPHSPVRKKKPQHMDKLEMLKQS